MQTLAELGEDALVESLTAMLPSGREVVVGPGDDCAAVRADGDRGGDNDLLLLKADCVVEGVHYLPDAAPSKVGHKAIARALSDIAAMGGRPAQALVTLVLPPDRTATYARALYRGLAKTAAAHGVSVVGGETARPARGGTGLVSVSLTGHVSPDRLCLRSGGQPGDRLFVTGKLGGSIAGRHLTFQPRIAEGQWLARHAKPSAMMDLSDGLGTDLPRLANASGCGWELDLRVIPRHRSCDIRSALGDGEDYELLLAVPDRRCRSLTKRWQKRFPNTPLTGIGTLAPTGSQQPVLDRGWTHF